MRMNVGGRMAANIYLIGFMGAGKSTIGKMLAQKLNRDFFDTDTLIEQKTGKTISDIFLRHGETHFRNLESETIAEIAAKNGAVVALGGGAVLRDDNWKKLKSSGVSVYLKWEVASLVTRIMEDESRPLLEPLAGKDREAEIKRLLRSRISLYEKADIVLDCQPDMIPAEVAERLSQILREEI